MTSLANLVHQTTTGAGTGNLTLVSVPGWRTFNDAFGTGGTDLFRYSARDKATGDYEIGTGHLSDATTLVRDTVIESSNADALLTPEHLQAWESRNGQIPKGAWVIQRTGWASRFTDDAAYKNVGDDGMSHVPGISKEAAEFLTQERDILGVGVETVGTDAGIAGTFDLPFPNHTIMHGAGNMGLTSLTNLDQLPEAGAGIVALPLKITDGSGSPVRVIALVAG